MVPSTAHADIQTQNEVAMGRHVFVMSNYVHTTLEEGCLGAIIKRQEAWYQVGRYRSNRTCRSIDGPCGKPSALTLSKGRTTNQGTRTYEDTSTTFSGGAFTSETLDLAIRVDLVVFQDRHFNFLALVLDLLGGLGGNIKNEQAKETVSEQRLTL